VLVAIAAFAGRAAYVLLVTRHQPPPDFAGEATGVSRSFDEFYYVQGAIALSEGEGLRFSAFAGAPAVEQAMHPPLTSALLAPFARVGHDRETVMRLAIAAAGVGVVVLLGLVGRMLAGDRAGIVAAVIGAVYPYLWMNDGLLLAETFATLGTVATVFFTYRVLRAPNWGDAIGAGLAAAFAMLSRAELALLLPLLIVPSILLLRTLVMRRRLALVAVACGAAVVAVAPWVVNDLGRFEEPVFLSYGSGSVLQGANCDATYGGERFGYWDGTCNPLTLRRGEDPSVEAGRRRERALDYIGDHLDEVPVVVAARVGRLWGVFRPIQTARDNQFEGRPFWASIAGLVMYVPLVGFAFGGVVVLARRKVPLVPLLAPVVIATLTAAAFYGLIRFRVPAEISLVLLAAVAIDAVWLGAARSGQRDSSVSRVMTP
jgi:4-amino-4-deoxy-L-arabinose transferase-like glycosyltransferase